MPGYNHEKYLQRYTAQPKQYVCYLIMIEKEPILKVGRTSRFNYRLRNLSQSLYQNFSYKLIPCENPRESLLLERHLKNVLSQHSIRGEWYRCRKEDIQAHLTGEYEKYLPALKDNTETKPAVNTANYNIYF
jgi:hypothetical protein